MNSDPRDRAFLELDAAQIGAITLRPITLGSLALLRETGSEFLAPLGPERDGAPTMRNELFAVLSFAFLHAAPLEEVRRVAFEPERFRAAVLAFGESLTPDSSAGLLAEIERRFAELAAVQFEVQPKPGEHAEEAAPPN